MDKCRLHKHLPLLRCAGIILRLNQVALTYQGFVCGSDVLMFSSFIYFAIRAEVRGSKIRTILRSMAEDSTRYFIVISTSHIVVEMTLNLGRVSATVSLDHAR